MKILLSFLFLLAMAPNLARAGQVIGFIEILAGQHYFVQSETNERYRIVGQTQRVQIDIRKLETGDFLRGSGNIYTSSQLLVLDSVNFVGLSKILGHWKSQNGEIFEFRDFTHLNFYEPIENFGIKLTHIRYSLAPDVDSQWSIILVNKDSVDIGQLSFTDKSVILEIFHPGTSVVRTTYFLSPVVQ